MNRSPSPTRRWRRAGAFGIAAALLLALLAACNRDGAAQAPSEVFVVKAGEVTKVPLTGTLAAGSTVEVVTEIDGLFATVTTTSNPPTLNLSTALDIDAQERAVTFRVQSGGSARDLKLNLSIHELLVITGQFSVDVTEDQDEAVVASSETGGVFRQIAQDYGGIDAFLETVGDAQVDPTSGRVRGLSPALSRFLRVLSGDEAIEDEYVVAIDADGKVLGSSLVDPDDDGSFSIRVHLDAATAASQPQIALLRGRGADPEELEVGGVDVVCIEPLEVADLDDDSVFTRTRRTRAMLLRYIINEIGIQTDALDPTRRLRTLAVGALTVNDQSAKMATAEADVFEDFEPQDSPFYEGGVFKQSLLNCGAKPGARSELEFELELEVVESDAEFVWNGGTSVSPTDGLRVLSNFAPSPVFDAGIAFDLPTETDFYDARLASTGINEADEALTLRRAAMGLTDEAFGVRLVTPFNRPLSEIAEASTGTRSLRTLFEDDDDLFPIGMDACALDFAKCDFDGGVTPILNFFEIAGLRTVQATRRGVRVKAEATIARINIVGQVVNTLGNPVASQIVTAFCTDTAVAIGRTDRAGRFVVTVYEDLRFSPDLYCTLSAGGRAGRGSLVVEWPGAQAGNLVLSRPLELQ